MDLVHLAFIKSFRGSRLILEVAEEGGEMVTISAALLLALTLARRLPPTRAAAALPGARASFAAAGYGKAQWARPRFSRYCWWYSSARQNAEHGAISVTIGRRKRPEVSTSALRGARASSCSASWKKIAERYWVPTSGPWRLSWVGSWFSQKTSSSCS